MRDSLLPRYELIAENWRHFNNIRPHSSLNCRQPKICAGRPGYVSHADLALRPTMNLDEF
jgi:hypothetical protein